MMAMALQIDRLVLLRFMVADSGIPDDGGFAVSTVLPSLFLLEQSDVLDVMGVREHVHGLDFHDTVFLVEHGNVTRLGGGVAAHIDQALGLGVEDDLDDVLVHACAGRVDNHDLGTAMLSDEAVGEHILHVPGIEQRVLDAVDAGIQLGVLDSLGDILDADDLTCLAGNEVGDGARAGVEVIDEFIAREGSHAACHLIEFVGLTGIGLVEGFGTDTELQAFHFFLDIVAAAVGDEFLVGKRVVDLEVDDVEQRSDLRETVTHSTHHIVDGGLIVLAEYDDLHHLARAGGAGHSHADEALLPTDVVERITLIHTVVADEQSHLVADVVLQPAALDVEHLVKGAGDVEARRIAVCSRR